MSHKTQTKNFFSTPNILLFNTSIMKEQKKQKPMQT